MAARQAGTMVMRWMHLWPGWNSHLHGGIGDWNQIKRYGGPDICLWSTGPSAAMLDRCFILCHKCTSPHYHVPCLQWHSYRGVIAPPPGSILTLKSIYFLMLGLMWKAFLGHKILDFEILAPPPEKFPCYATACLSKSDVRFCHPSILGLPCYRVYFNFK